MMITDKPCSSGKAHARLRALYAFLSPYVNLEHTLQDHPELLHRPPVDIDTIDYHDAMQWGSLMQDPTHPLLSRLPMTWLYGHRLNGATYESHQITEPLLGKLVESATIAGASIDIRDITGLSQSVSDLSLYRTVEEFAVACCSPYINQGTNEAVAANMQHREIRIDGREFRGRFYYHAWSNRLYWGNNGGSHHLATASYIARHLGEDALEAHTRYRGTIVRSRLCEESVKALTEKYAMFAFESCDSGGVYALYRALSKADVTYYRSRVPVHAHNSPVVLLPTGDSSSRRAAKLLSRFGCFDYSQYMQELVRRQARHEREQPGLCN